MSKFWEVFRYELIRNGRRKGYLAATFGLPLVIALLLFGFHIYQSNQTVEEENPLLEALSLDSIKSAGYVDESGFFSEVPSRFADVLTLYPDETSAKAALEAEEIEAYFVYKADYIETGNVVLHLPNLQLNLLSDGSSLAEQLIYSNFASGIDESRLQRLNNPANYIQYEVILDETGVSIVSNTGLDEAAEGGQFAVVYIFTILFFIALMATNTYLMQTVIEERENRLIEILLATVTPTQLLGGKIFAMACLGLFQLAVWIGSGALLFIAAGNLETYAIILAAMNIQLRPEWLLLMISYFLLMYLLFAAVFGTIGAISGSAQEGSQYAGLVLLPTMIPYYFFSLIQAEPNGIVASVLSIIPLTSPITTISRMVVTDVPLWQIFGSVALVGLTAFAALWMAGRIFRVQTLVSGQKFKLQDIPRLIFSEGGRKRAKEA